MSHTNTNTPIAPVVEYVARTPSAAVEWDAAGYDSEMDLAGRVALYRHLADGTPCRTNAAYVEHIAQAGPLVLIVARQTGTDPIAEGLPLDYEPLIGIVLAAHELAEHPALSALLDPPSPPAAPIPLPSATAGRWAAAA